MMKNFYPLILISILLSACTTTDKTTDNWNITWQEDFNGATLDTTKWTKIPRGRADWNRHMSDGDSLYDIKNGRLILKGMTNYNPADTAPVVTGGVFTKDKFYQTYGRVEISAKLGCSVGAWPAFWMLPQEGKWPNGGEIDIMEHLNYDTIAYQTVHSYYTYVLQEKTPPKGAIGKIDNKGFNTYRLDWYPDSLVFFINNNHTFTYPKIETDKEGQWPFTTPFYLLLDMQLGGSWVGKIDKNELPVEMEIDWVKFYDLPKKYLKK